MTGFRSDTEGLAKYASEFSDHATRAEQVARTLHEALESCGDCWGTDKLGRLFAAAHQPGAEQAPERVSALAALLRDTGAKFAASTEAQTRVDTSNADLLAGR